MLLGSNEDKKASVKRYGTVIYWEQDSSLRCSDKSKIFLINHTPFRGEQQATIL